MIGQPVSRAATLRKTAIVAAFTVLCGAVFTFLWVNSGGRVPAPGGGKYTVSADFEKVANLVYFSDVMVAGVKIGKVTRVEARGDHARVELELEESVAPLHEGATLQMRSKSLVEESFIAVVDGDGPELPSGSTLPASATTPATQLGDVLQSFDPQTRARLGELVRSGGMATADTRESVESALIGLGKLGREGSTVVHAIAAQSRDLEELTRSSTQVLAALGTRREQLRSLVANADTVSRVTAAQQQDLRATVNALPPLLDAARGSSDDLQRLGRALTSVADNLSAAAPDLTAALRELPATSHELRLAMPHLDSVVNRAPATLHRVPALSQHLRTLMPHADGVLADANPMLSYLSPYHRDAAAFFANFAAVLASGDANGKFLRIMPGFNEQSYKGWPVMTNIGPLNRSNPLPGPGSLEDPAPYSGTYPRVGEK